MRPTVGSLFSGIGGLDLGLERAGWEVRWQVEIDPFCRKVLGRHWPDIKKYGDIREVNPDELEPVDLVCGGFPCQDLSVAGKRAGVAGERSGLFWEVVRIADEVRPSWLVLENVPGLLSSNEGRDMETVLNAIEELGYIVDCDIMDAQYFGVAQRRRRVFIVCQHVDHLLSQRTITSALTISQCLIESLGGILVEALRQSRTECETSDCPKWLSVDGLKRRMKLFGIADKQHWPKLLKNLTAEKAKCPQGLKNSGWIRGANERGTSETITGEKSLGTSERTATLPASWNTDTSWSNILDVVYNGAKLFTTSIATKTITEFQIYTYAQACLTISEHIAQLNCSSPSLWTAASSALIVLRECIKYARHASRSLFTAMEWVQPWADFVWKAEPTCDALRCVRDNSGADEILPLPESCSGNPPPSREKGSRVGLPAVSRSLKASGGFKQDPTHETYIVAATQFCGNISGPLTGGSGQRGWKVNAENAADGQLVVAHTLTGRHDSSEDGTGRGIPLVVAFSAGQGAKAGGIGYREEQAPTLKAAASGTNMVPTVI
jgi:DNA-cytosine methyltransferase